VALTTRKCALGAMVPSRIGPRLRRAVGAICEVAPAHLPADARFHGLSNIILVE
jgi:hypothetical protein